MSKPFYRGLRRLYSQKVHTLPWQSGYSLEGKRMFISECAMFGDITFILSSLEERRNLLS